MRLRVAQHTPRKQTTQVEVTDMIQRSRMRPIQGSWQIQEALQNDIGIDDLPKVEDMLQPYG